MGNACMASLWETDDRKIRGVSHHARNLKRLRDIYIIGHLRLHVF